MRGKGISTETLYAAIHKAIVAGRYKPGEKFPSERTLAQEFACSRSTLEKALARLAADGFLVRRPRSGTCAAIPQAAFGSGAVVFVYPGLPHEGHSRIVRGFCKAAVKKGLRAITVTTGSDYRREADMLTRLAAFGVRGAGICPVVSHPNERRHYYDALSQCAIPFVQAGAILATGEIPTVDADFMDAGYCAARHLLVDCGLKRLGFLSNFSWTGMVRDMLRGFRKAFSDLNGVADESLVYLTTAMHPDYDDPFREGTRLALAYLKAHPDVEGIVAGNDFLAVGFLRAAEMLGRRVPENLQVAGIGDFAFAAHEHPALTTVHVNYEAIGEKTFEAVMELASGDVAETHVEAYLPVLLTERDSTSRCQGTQNKSA